MPDGSCTPLPHPPPSLSHSPSGEDWRHDPDERRVKGEVILRGRQRRHQRGPAPPRTALHKARKAPGCRGRSYFEGKVK